MQCDTDTSLPSYVVTSSAVKELFSDKHTENGSIEPDNYTPEMPCDVDTVPTINTEIETEEDQTVKGGQQKDHSDLRLDQVESGPFGLTNEHDFQSKIAKAILKSVGHYPELIELDRMKVYGDTQSNTYKALLRFFRGKVLACRTKIQLEMIKLEKQNAKKTLVYTN